MTGGISPQKALVISLPLDGGSCSGLYTYSVGCGCAVASHLKPSIMAKSRLASPHPLQRVVTRNSGEYNNRDAVLTVRLACILSRHS